MDWVCCGGRIFTFALKLLGQNQTIPSVTMTVIPTNFRMKLRRLATMINGSGKDMGGSPLSCSTIVVSSTTPNCTSVLVWLRLGAARVISVSLLQQAADGGGS